jgi:hypothetical protein
MNQYWYTIINLSSYFIQISLFVCLFSSNMEFELRASSLLCTHSITWVTLAVLSWIFFFFFFCGSGIWTQALHLDPLHQNFLMHFIKIGFLELFALGWLWTTVLLISASWVARITGMSHQRLDVFFSFRNVVCFFRSWTPWEKSSLYSFNAFSWAKVEQN